MTCFLLSGQRRAGRGGVHPIFVQTKYRILSRGEHYSDR
ncbi:hypothetical protein L838_2961 [Mycobacterium avium MAV_120709_2344]|nr:hypothetical protein L838_2961 [Mycobacterium avium MAV_120709_2344]